MSMPSPGWRSCPGHLAERGATIEPKEVVTDVGNDGDAGSRNDRTGKQQSLCGAKGLSRDALDVVEPQASVVSPGDKLVSIVKRLSIHKETSR